jgi:hypothetical protein
MGGWVRQMALLVSAVAAAVVRGDEGVYWLVAVDGAGYRGAAVARGHVSVWIDLLAFWLRGYLRWSG